MYLDSLGFKIFVLDLMLFTLTLSYAKHTCSTILITDELIGVTTHNLTYWVWVVSNFKYTMYYFGCLARLIKSTEMDAKNAKCLDITQ